MTRPSRGTRPTYREPRSLSWHPRGRFPLLRLGVFDNTPDIHLDGALRRSLPVALDSWAGRPSEGRVLLSGVQRVPLLSYPRAPVVIGWSGVGLESPRVRIGTDRDPRSAAPPRRGAPSRGPGCISPSASGQPTLGLLRARDDRTGLPSRRPYGRGIAKRSTHRSRWR